MNRSPKHIKAALEKFSTAKSDYPAWKTAIAEITALLEKAYLIALETTEEQAHYDVLVAQEFAEFATEVRGREYARQNPHDEDRSF